MQNFFCLNISRSVNAFPVGLSGQKGDCVPRCDPSKIARYLSGKSGIQWKYDGLRHSYASSRLALTKDIAALSDEMSNSVKMIKVHYLDRKHEDEGANYFGIRRGNLSRLELDGAYFDNLPLSPRETQIGPARFELATS